MSAFIVSSKHIAALAAYACYNQLVIPAWAVTKDKQKHSLVANVAIGLMKENMRSIECSYPNDEDDTIVDRLTLAECVELADKYLENQPKLTPTEIFKLAECYAHQACECDNWEETNAYRQYKAIANHAARKALLLTKEYYAAKWTI